MGSKKSRRLGKINKSRKKSEAAHKGLLRAKLLKELQENTTSVLDMTGGIRCVYWNCTEMRNQNPDYSFFTFPACRKNNPSPEDYERQRQWLDRCGKNTEAISDLKTSWRICSKHFHEKDMYFNNRRRQLHQNAIPMDYRDFPHESDLQSCEPSAKNGEPSTTVHSSNAVEMEKPDGFCDSEHTSNNAAMSFLIPNSQDTNPSWIQCEMSMPSSTRELIDTPETSYPSDQSQQVSDNESETVIEPDINDYMLEEMEDLDQQSWDEDVDQQKYLGSEDNGDKSPTKQVRKSSRQKKESKTYYQNKKLREQGAPYLGRSRKVEGVGTTYVVKCERQMKPPCTSNFCIRSKKRFCNEFTQEDRLLNFNRFWGNTWAEKKAYVMTLVTITNPQQSRGHGIHSPRTTTLRYYLFKTDGQRYPVCQKFFCNTLSIVNSTVVRWVFGPNYGKSRRKTEEGYVVPGKMAVPETENQVKKIMDNLIAQLPDEEESTIPINSMPSTGGSEQPPEKTSFDCKENFEVDSSMNHPLVSPEFVSLPLPNENPTNVTASFNRKQRQQVRESSDPEQLKKEKKTAVKGKRVSSANTSEPNLGKIELPTAAQANPHRAPPMVSRGFFGVSSIKKNEEMIDLTGIPIEAFAHLLTLLPQYLRSSENHQVNIKDCLLIFLMKMRHGHTDTALAVLFGFNSTAISHIFIDVLYALYKKTRLGYIVWPSRQTIDLIMPDVFKQHHPKIRAIVDMIKIVSPQANSFLIGISPSGLVCYKSTSLTEDPSIKANLQAEANFCDQLAPGDEVLSCVDTFKLTNKSATINFDFQTTDVQKLVNNSVQRVKDYNILTKLTPQLHPYSNEIVHMVCVLANLQICH